MGLTPKQQAFCDYYIETGNAAEAARRAGYSAKTANVVGYENLTKPYIQGCIEGKMAEKDAKRIAKQDEVLQFFTSMMRGEIPDSAPRDRLTAAIELNKRHLSPSQKAELESAKIQAQIELLKAQISKITGTNDNEEQEDDGFIDALSDISEGVWDVDNAADEPAEED